MDLSCPTVLRAQSTSPFVQQVLGKNWEISTYVAHEGLAPGLEVCSRRTRYRGPEFNKGITPVAIPSEKLKNSFDPFGNYTPGPVWPCTPCQRKGCAGAFGRASLVSYGEIRDGY